MAVSAAASASASARKALAEHRQHVALGWRQRVVGGGLAGGLDPRRGRRAPGAGVLGGGGEVLEGEADVDRPLPRLGARPRREVGQAVEQHHHLHHRARPGASPPAAPRRRAGRRCSGSQLSSTVRARTSSPPAVTTPSARAVLARARAPPGHSSRTRAPAASAAGAQGRGDRAHSPARVAPGARHPVGLAEVVVEADEGGAGILGPGQRADQALYRERHAHELRRDRRQLVGHAAVENALPHGIEPALAVGRLADTAAARARRRAPSAPRTPRSRRRPPRPVRARCPSCVRSREDHVTTVAAVGKRREQPGLVRGRRAGRGARARDRA